MLFWIKEIKTKKKIIEPVGTLRYASTEALANKLYNSSKIDIFSLGVILFYLINNSILFNKATEGDIFLSLIKLQILKNIWVNLKILESELVLNNLKKFKLKMV